jgi:L-histidine Nalpha-methyltransferase
MSAVVPVRAAPGADAQFAADVRSGLLRQGQKTLPPRYLYDALGSALFEAITQLPEYGLWRAEQALLAEHALQIASIGRVATVVELGSGSASKTALLLQTLLRRHAVSYHAIDVSATALALTRQSLAALSGLSVHGIQADYLEGLDTALRARSDDAALVLLLGSSLGNLDPDASLRFLRRVRRALRPGDALLLGADLLKPEPRLLAAYDDALGVTAAFNLNLLVRMNRELGANFRLTQFRHRARFNHATQDVEMHLESLGAQRVRFADEFAISLQPGETIHTESSHKYDLRQLGHLLEDSGFRLAAQWINQEWQFASRLEIAG